MAFLCLKPSLPSGLGMLPPLVVGFVERNRGVFGHELRLVDRNAITLKRVVVCSRKNKLKGRLT
jgi:hypothetical protein